MEIQVENIKCGGCINSITKALENLVGVSDVKIDLENEIIHLNAPESTRAKIVEKLHKMGYPEKGNNSIFEKAKSYVSCAVGKMT